MSFSGLFSVVITTFNDKIKLRDCLHSVLNQSCPRNNVEVIVIDDGSSDGTAELVAEEFPEVRLIRKENTGPDNSRNMGLDCARGEIVSFIDSDCVAPQDWLENVVNSLERNRVTAVGGPIRHQGDFWVRVIAISDFGEFQSSTEKEVTTIPTCNLGVRRLCLGDLRFHPQLKAGGDVLFCHSLRQRGHILLYDPAVNVVHRPTGGWRSLLRRARGDGEAFVVPRLLDPTLPHARFLEYGLCGVVLATIGRTWLDWRRLIRYRQNIGFSYGGLLAAALALSCRRLLSVPGTIRVYRSGLPGHESPSYK